MRLLGECKCSSQATGGLVAFKEAAQAVAIGQAAGLTADQLERLGRVAKNAGTILGRDVTDAFNRLTRGAIKAEPELLDELGIIIRRSRNSRLCWAIGKNVNTLTQFEKTQAVVNAVLEQGESKFNDSRRIGSKSSCSVWRSISRYI